MQDCERQRTKQASTKDEVSFLSLAPSSSVLTNVSSRSELNVLQKNLFRAFWSVALQVKHRLPFKLCCPQVYISKYVVILPYAGGDPSLFRDTFEVYHRVYRSYYYRLVYLRGRAVVTRATGPRGSEREIVSAPFFFLTTHSAREASSLLTHYICS